MEATSAVATNGSSAIVQKQTSESKSFDGSENLALVSDSKTQEKP